MKQTYSGSNAMYADHDNLQPKAKPKRYELKVANCRGKKPVLNDIKKARNILQNLLIELNSCAGEAAIKKCTSTLWDILEDNKP